MTVMSNTYIQETFPYSSKEILAAKNAFLQYDREQQLHLLTLMPLDEAVGILSHCSVGHVQQLIVQLEQEEHGKRAAYFAHHLGFSCLNVENQTVSKKRSILDTFKQKFTWVALVVCVGTISGIMFV